MSFSTQLRSMVAYNRWANERIIAASDVLPDDAFAREDPDGLSLRHVLEHALGTQIWWLGNWTGVSAPGVDLPGSREGLRRAYQDAHDRMDEFVAATDDAAWARIVEFAFPGAPPMHLPAWQTMSQVLMHGVQHRAEAAVLLTRAGHSPGNMDYILWLLDPDGRFGR